MKKAVLWLVFYLAVGACGGTGDEPGTHVDDTESKGPATKAQMQKYGVGISCATADRFDKDGKNEDGKSGTDAVTAICGSDEARHAPAKPSWATDLGDIHVGPPDPDGRMAIGFVYFLVLDNPTGRTAEYVMEVESDVGCWDKWNPPDLTSMDTNGKNWISGTTCQTKWSLGEKAVSWKFYYADGYTAEKSSTKESFGEFKVTFNVVE